MNLREIKEAIENEDCNVIGDIEHLPSDEENEHAEIFSKYVIARRRAVIEIKNETKVEVTQYFEYDDKTFDFVSEDLPEITWHSGVDFENGETEIDLLDTVLDVVPLPDMYEYIDSEREKRMM